jgi:hypothetical protein
MNKENEELREQGDRLKYGNLVFLEGEEMCV